MGREPIDPKIWQVARGLSAETGPATEVGGLGVLGGRIYAVPGGTLWGRDSTGGGEMRDVRTQRNSAESWPKVVIIVLNWNGWLG